MQKHLAAHTRKRHAQHMRCAVPSAKSIDPHVFHRGNAVGKPLFQRIHPIQIGIQVLIHLLCRFSHACDCRNIFCTGAQSPLLSAAEHDRTDFHAIPDIQKSDSLRSVDFVSRNRQHVDFHPFRQNFCLAIALHRVHVEQRVRIDAFDQLARLCDRLKGSDLIIRVHDRNQNRIRTDRRFQIGQTDFSVFIDRQIRHLKALLLQILHRIEDRRMLNRCRNQMLALPCICIRCTAQRQIIRLRPAGGKEDLLGRNL